MGNKIIEDKNKRFVNPYNFIPLGKKCQREQPKIVEEDCHTGYFDCSMRLLSPLFIPNTSSFVRLLEKGERDNYKEGKGYDFFSYDDWSDEEPYSGTLPSPPSNPVIPGSEIRGSVRSVYEAAFNGCMSSVDGGRDLSRRCGEVKLPGILYWNKRENGWYLKECKKARLRVQQKAQTDGKYMVSRTEYDRWKEGQEIWIIIDDKKNRVKDYKLIGNTYKRKQETIPGYRKGYLHKGEYIEGKHCESVFYEDKKTTRREPIKVCDEDIQLLQKVLDEYKDNKKNSKVQNEKWYEEFTISKDGRNILVYYAKDNKNRVYMCPACIGRESFEKTVESLLIKNGDYQPCSDERLCSSCQIFGMMDKAEKSGTYAYGSKIRVTDATLIQPPKDSSSLFEKPIVLPELGEPRPSAVEYYTESPYKPTEMPDKGNMQGYWTYDYKYKFKNDKKNSIERISLDENQPKIRGRKFYWHSVVNLEAFHGNQVNDMRQRIRPLKANMKIDSKPTFQFRVYFEQLNKKQVEQLKWAMDFGNTDFAHKIGRGKPLGFGSVQIVIESLHIREIEEHTGNWVMTTMRESGKSDFKYFFGDSGFTEKEIPDALKIMLNWKNRPRDVRYPLGVDKSVKEIDKANEDASHQWFRLNKVQQDNFKHNFSKVLSDVADDVKSGQTQDKALYKLIKKK